MAKQKKNEKKEDQKQTIEELRKRGIELSDEDQISGGFPDYPIPPTVDDPEKDKE